MRKIVLYSAMFLLITSTLFVTVTAKKPQPETTYTVVFTDDIFGSNELLCRDRGNNLDLYGKADLNFINTGSWNGPHYGNLRIFIVKETNEVVDLIYDFDTQEFNGKNYPKYHLRGPNSDGTYDISDIVIERKGKKGALSLYYVYITSLSLEFVVEAEANP